MGFFSNSDNDKTYTEQASTEQATPLTSMLDINDITNRATSSISSFFNNDTINDALTQLQGIDNWSRGSSVPGLKAYPFPSVEKYDKCINNDGLSVWDENGWWRCLFPNAKARRGEISREDVENDKGNKFGLFFKDYNELMGWRSQLRKLAKEKELVEQAKNVQTIYDDYAKDVDGEQEVIPVRTSKSVSFRTLENGDSEEITKIYNVFSDGRKQNEVTKKIFPRDGGEPIVTKETDDKSKGWIWK